MVSSFLPSPFKNKTNKNPTCLCQLERICKSSAKKPHSYCPNGIWDEPTGNSWLWICLYSRLLWHADHFWTNFWHHHLGHMNGTQRWKPTSNFFFFFFFFWKRFCLVYKSMLQRITKHIILVVTSNIWLLCVTMILGQTERRSKQHTGNKSAISMT